MPFYSFNKTETQNSDFPLMIKKISFTPLKGVLDNSAENRGST